jgi:ABC-type Fe3+ transport system permease subunit
MADRPCGRGCWWGRCAWPGCCRRCCPLGGWLLALVPAPLFLPPLVHVLSWFGLLGLTGWPGIVLVYVISFTPFVVLMTVKALEQVARDPVEMLELMGGRAAVLG